MILQIIGAEGPSIWQGMGSREIVFSRLKEVFGLSKNRFAGIQKGRSTCLFLPYCVYSKIRVSRLWGRNNEKT